MHRHVGRFSLGFCLGFLDTSARAMLVSTFYRFVESGDAGMTTQISAHISDETRSQIERLVRRRGVTKARLIEDALQHHLAALREIPEDLVVPVRLTLSQACFEDIIVEIESDAPPNEALRELMRGDG
jgi:predicted DNA-binding protein